MGSRLARSRRQSCWEALSGISHALGTGLLPWDGWTWNPELFPAVFVWLADSRVKGLQYSLCLKMMKGLWSQPPQLMLHWLAHCFVKDSGACTDLEPSPERWKELIHIPAGRGGIRWSQVPRKLNAGFNISHTVSSGWAGNNRMLPQTRRLCSALPSHAFFSVLSPSESSPMHIGERTSKLHFYLIKIYQTFFASSTIFSPTVSL